MFVTIIMHTEHVLFVNSNSVYLPQHLHSICTQCAIGCHRHMAHDVSGGTPHGSFG